MSDKPTPWERLSWDEDQRVTLFGLPFTGKAIERSPAGVTTTASFVQGVDVGLWVGHFDDGSLAFAEERNGGLSGRHTRWYPGGALRRDALYEHGVRVEDRRWNSAGHLVEEYQAPRRELASNYPVREDGKYWLDVLQRPLAR